MILPQPGKRDIHLRTADNQWLVYRFSPSDERAMQWEVMRVFKTPEEARVFAFPPKVGKVKKA